MAESPGRILPELTETNSFSWTSGEDRTLPLNTHGGQLSSGRLHRYGFIHEVVTQLRGHAGERQVRDAETAVVSTGGGAPGGVLLFTTGR